MSGQSQRIHVGFSGYRLTLLSHTVAPTKSMASDSLSGHEGRAGFWYELRDAQERVRYRRSVPNPIRFESEFHEIRKGKPTSSTQPARKPPSGDFIALLPIVEGANRLVLMGSKTPGAPAEELARLVLPEGA